MKLPVHTLHDMVAVFSINLAKTLDHPHSETDHAIKQEYQYISQHPYIGMSDVAPAGSKRGRTIYFKEKDGVHPLMNVLKPSNQTVMAQAIRRADYCGVLWQSAHLPSFSLRLASAVHNNTFIFYDLLGKAHYYISKKSSKDADHYFRTKINNDHLFRLLNVSQTMYLKNHKLQGPAVVLTYTEAKLVKNVIPNMLKDVKSVIQHRFD